MSDDIGYLCLSKDGHSFDRRIIIAVEPHIAIVNSIWVLVISGESATLITGDFNVLNSERGLGRIMICSFSHLWQNAVLDISI